MKIKITKETAVLVDNVYNVVSYLHEGDEFDVFPTDDGMKFEAFGKLISPYDLIGSFDLID